MNECFCARLTRNSKLFSHAIGAITQVYWEAWNRRLLMPTISSHSPWLIHPRARNTSYPHWHASSWFNASIYMLWTNPSHACDRRIARNHLAEMVVLFVSMADGFRMYSNMCTDTPSNQIHYVLHTKYVERRFRFLVCNFDVIKC